MVAVSGKSFSSSDTEEAANGGANTTVPVVVAEEELNVSNHGRTASGTMVGLFLM